MPAERDRWEARNCKEIDKYTSATVAFSLQELFFIIIIFSREWRVLFSVCSLWGEKVFYFIFFLFFQNTLEQSELCQETADKSQ